MTPERAAIVTLRPKIEPDRRIGHLVVIAAAETPGHWIAQCKHPLCSNRQPKGEYSEEVLLAATVSTCGCNYPRNADFQEYNTWKQARARCRNPRHAHYSDYGGRGISFDKSWDDFKVFYRDMGPRPTKQHQLHRNDNDAGYSPSNCTWKMPAQHLGPGMRRAPKSAPIVTAVTAPISTELEAKVQAMISSELLLNEIVARVMGGTPEQLRAEAEAKRQAEGEADRRAEAEAEAEFQADILEAEAEFQAELRQANGHDKPRRKRNGASTNIGDLVHERLFQGWNSGIIPSPASYQDYVEQYRLHEALLLKREPHLTLSKATRTTRRKTAQKLKSRSVSGRVTSTPRLSMGKTENMHQ